GYHFHFGLEEAGWKLPPLSAFVADRDRSRLLSAPFQDYLRVEPAARGSVQRVLSFLTALDNPDKPPTNPLTAERLSQRDPALLLWQPPLPGSEAKPSGAELRLRGRVALFTSTANADWTDWPRQHTFLPLIQELLPVVSAGRLREQSLTVGDA